MTIPRFKATASANEVAAAIEEGGGAIIENLLPPDVVSTLRADFEPSLEKEPFERDNFQGHRTKRLGKIAELSEKAREVMLHPTVTGVMSNCRKSVFGLHGTQVIQIHPGSPEQEFHRDGIMYLPLTKPPGRQLSINTMWAITDFTEENGATRVIPNTHNIPFDQHYVDLSTLGEPEVATMPAGSVLLWTGETVHAAGANTTDSCRIGLSLWYMLAVVRPWENHYLGLVWAITRSMAR
jgi:ectoine hydroxylase-related dioxygenase (phytanoyl-CoA dioxygenase family)